MSDLECRESAPPSNPGQAIALALARAEEMKLFPAAALRIQRVVDDPDCSLMELEEAVASDPTLSAQVLRIANSSFYGLSRKVASLRQALMVLGFDATRDMSLALAFLSHGRSERPARHSLWRHSIRTGVLARRLARRSGALDAADALVAGLLHDLGKFLMLDLKEEEYSALLEVRADQPDPLEAERRLFLVDHAQLGAACLERWSMPHSLCDAARAHHQAALKGGPEQELTWLVSLADLLEHTLARQLSPREAAEAVAASPIAAQLGAASELMREAGEKLDADESELLPVS